MAFLSQRNRMKLSDDGFSYLFDRFSSDGEVKFWRCERKREGCKARLHTDVPATTIVKHVGEHNHDANAAGVEVQVCTTAIKKRAIETQETTAQVLTASVTTLSEAAQAQLPNIAAQKKARMISSLAFVPVNDLDAKMADLGGLLPVELQPVLSYFEDTYVGRPMINGRRRQPLFAPVVWNVYDRTIANAQRTNNHAEAAHRRIQSEMAVDHPTIWRFVEGLRKVQKGRDVFHHSLIRGDGPPQKLKRYRVADARILTIVNDYANRTTAEYLRGLAHNFEMNP